MKDYSAMSDFEINLAVAHIDLGKGNYDWSAEKKEVYRAGMDGGEFLPNAYFDPCKNPTDAYPIMLEHGIGIDYDGISWAASDWRENKHSDWRNHPESPLRLAMIVFLMMKDRESSHG